MKSEILAVIGLILLQLSFSVNAQTTIRLIDFETVEGYTTSIPVFTDNATDYFIRTNGSDITGEQFTNINGEYFFAAQDIDGEGASLPVSLTIDDIDISNYTSLLFRVYLAEDPTGDSEHWDGPDYVHFSYSIDDGASTDLLWIETLGDTTNGPPGIDTNFDGNGDGTEITGAFNQFEASIAGTGSTLDIIIEFNLGSGDEDIAIDNVEILGNSASLPIGIITGSEGWRLISIPKENATGSDIADDGIGAQFTSNQDSATIYTYNNSGTYLPLSTEDDTILSGNGLAVYFFNNNVNGSTILPISLDAIGNEPLGDISVDLNTITTVNSSYFTLVGNPFGSNYDLNTLTFNNESIQNNIHVLSEGIYSPIDRNSTIVTPWQGFWVEGSSTNVDSLTFPVAGKTTSSSTISALSKQISNEAEIVLSIHHSDVKSDAIKIKFNDDARTGWDLDDSSKLQPLLNQYAIISFKGNKDDLDVMKSIESLPQNLTKEVKLDLEVHLVGVSGEFNLSWSGFESIPAEWEFTFHDYETETNVDMRVDSLYSFDATALASKINTMSILKSPSAIALKSKMAGTRFSITISPTTSVSNELDLKVREFTLDQNYPNPFNPSTTINYSVGITGKVALTVYNLMGQKMAELVNEAKSAGSYSVIWDATQLASGMYYYRLEADGQTLTRKMTLIK